MDKFNDVFISYGRGDDEAFVFQLYRDLAARNITVWHDKSGGLESNGLSFLSNIATGISASIRLLLVIGPHSSNSVYVKAEWKEALAKCAVIIPLLRLGVQTETKKHIPSDEDYNLIPPELAKRRLHCIDFRMHRPYEDALQELLNNLQTAILPLATLPVQTNLPQNFVPRSAEIELLKGFIMKDSYQPVLVASTAKNTAISGMGGLGKSVLAASICHDCDVRRLFQDGIYWIHIGRDKTNLQRKLQEITNDYTIDLRDHFDESKLKVHKFLESRNCLLVVDDVWEAEDVEIFVRDTAFQCRLLITTRNREAVTGLALEVHELGLLTLSDSRELLHKAVNTGRTRFPIDQLPPEAQAILEQCGGLPLAINMAGGMISEGSDSTWKDVLEALTEADLSYLEKKFQGYPYPNLFKVLDVSVSALEEEKRNKYKQFAVFPRQALIPGHVVHLLCGNGEAERHTNKFLNELVSRSLLQRNSEGFYSLHDLQMDYLRTTGVNLPQLNADLIGKIGDPWKAGSPYVWRYYIWHLIQAGQRSDCLKLLTDFTWIKAKLLFTDVYSLLDDFELSDPNDGLHGEIYRALRVSAYVLSQNKNQLASQLLLRIFARPNTQSFLDDCAELADKPWLRPRSFAEETTIQPDRIFRTYEDRITGMEVSDKHLVACTVGGSAFVWNRLTGRLVSKVLAHAGPANAVLLFDSFFVTAGKDALLKIWTLDSGDVLIGKGHSDSIWKLVKYGEYIISASNDHSIRLWNTRGEQQEILLTTTAVIPQIEIVQHDQLMCSSRDKIYLYDIENRTLLQLLEHDARVSIFFVMENKIISATIEGIITVWDLNSGYRLGTLKIQHRNIYKMLAFRTTVLIGSFTEPVLLALDVNTLEMQKFSLFTREGIYSMLIHKNWLIAGLFSGTLRIFDLDDLSKTNDINDIPDASQFLAIHRNALYAGTYGGMIYSWNTRFLDAGLPQKTKVGVGIETGGITRLKAAGQNLYLTTSNKFIQKWSFRDCQLLYSVNLDTVYSIPKLNLATYDFALIDQYIGVSDWDGNVVFLDAEKGELAFSTRQFKSSFAPIKIPAGLVDPKTSHLTVAVMCIRINSQFAAATTASGVLRVWDLTGKREYRRVTLGEFGSYTFFMNGFLVFPVSNGDLLLIDTSDFDIPFTLRGHSDFVSSFANYNGILITASGDGTINFWTLKDTYPIKTIHAHSAQITGIRIYGNLLISCSMDSKLKIWDLNTYKLVNEIQGLQDFQSLKISSDLLLAISRSGFVGVYDLKDSLREVTSFTSDDLTYFFEVSQEHNKIAFGGRSGKLHFVEAAGFQL